MSNDLQREFVGISDAALDDLRKRIGVKIGRTLEPWCYEATRDNIRHYAHGIGDDNPLWCDPEYARTTPYGEIIAPHRLFSRVAALSAVTWVACPAFTRCSPVVTLAG